AGDPTWWLEYAYDGSGNVTRVTDSAGGVTEYEYDGIDRLISIRQSGAGVLEKRVDFESTPTGLPLVIRRFADLAGTVAGPVTTYTYACAGCGNRLSSIVHSQPDGTVIRELSFTRNALGQVLELTDLDGVHRFSWDGRGWLSDEQHPPASPLPSGATTWDGVGNWLDRPAAAGPANLSYQGGSAGHRLLDDGTFSYSWSGAGQLTVRESLSTGERLLLDYSPEYRIRTMTLENGGGQTLSSGSYIHALTGWRVRSELDGTARHYPHDFENPALALDSSGSVVWRRLYGRAIDRPYAIERNGELRWLLTDMVGTVLAEADTAGQVLADYRYDSFGRQVSGAAPTLDDSLRFAGRDFDLPGGFGYFRARIYDPQNGRFVSEDPLPRWLYQYGENNPIQYVDPTGESALLEYALFLCDVAGLWVSYRPVGLGVDQGIAVAAAAIAGQPGGSADVYSMIPAPTVPPGTGEGPAGPEIAKSLVLACGSSALL
ncbi:MAG: RHS repeat-associated core domain-containing protein, partial [Pseudomonadota bacterium]